MDLTDLHVHLRGSINKANSLKLIEKYSACSLKKKINKNHKDFLKNRNHLDVFFDNTKSVIERADSLYSFQTLNEFFASYLLSAYLFQDLEDLNYLLYSVSNNFKNQGIKNADLIVSPHHYLVGGRLSLHQILEVFNDYDFDDLNINWVIDPVRDRGEGFCIELISECYSIYPSLFKAINLGGNEDLFPANQFKNLYRKASDLGLDLRMHAGETDNIYNIEYAVKELGCKRIGHGISSSKSKELMRYLADNKIYLEICISSNILLGEWALEDYPLRELVDNGVPVLICTDDPGFLSTSLLREYELVKELGFSEKEIFKLMEEASRFFNKKKEVEGAAPTS